MISKSPTGDAFKLAISCLRHSTLDMIATATLKRGRTVPLPFPQSRYDENVDFAKLHVALVETENG
jgi:hypothetical protein